MNNLNISILQFQWNKNYFFLIEKIAQFIRKKNDDLENVND
jgi:hypothetical protein